MTFRERRALKIQAQKAFVTALEYLPESLVALPKLVQELKRLNDLLEVIRGTVEEAGRGISTPASTIRVDSTASSGTNPPPTATFKLEDL